MAADSSVLTASAGAVFPGTCRAHVIASSSLVVLLDLHTEFLDGASRNLRAEWDRYHLVPRHRRTVLSDDSISDSQGPAAQFGGCADDDHCLRALVARPVALQHGISGSRQLCAHANARRRIVPGRACRIARAYACILELAA